MSSTTTILKVEGMTCSHCENRVKTTVAELPGVSGVAVSLADKTVTIDFDPEAVTLETISEAIEDQGYDVLR